MAKDSALAQREGSGQAGRRCTGESAAAVVALPCDGGLEESRGGSPSVRRHRAGPALKRIQPVRYRRKARRRTGKHTLVVEV